MRNENNEKVKDIGKEIQRLIDDSTFDAKDIARMANVHIIYLLYILEQNSSSLNVNEARYILKALERKLKIVEIGSQDCDDESEGWYEIYDEKFSSVPKYRLSIFEKCLNEIGYELKISKICDFTDFHYEEDDSDFLLEDFCYDDYDDCDDDDTDLIGEE